ncbi:MAG: FAD-dependent oxidoreductase [Gammaproteobacteria bacterium]|nr:FAD-dependent oxidoreductase [Gammaproteobacteria bacterium]
MQNPLIIIGTGLAGYQLAREWRRADQTTPLLIITADEGNFYSKPLLSTALTQGKTSASLTTATAEAMATQLNATVRTRTKVTRIDPDAKTIYIGDEAISYAKLVLACGADVIKAPLQGDGVSSVLSVNHLYHYAAFQELIKNKKKIAILGAGLIGCEFANDLSNAGYEVDVIAPAKSPLDLLIPEDIGQLLQSALAANGVKWHLQCVVNIVTKTDSGFSLTLSNGEQLETEFVLSAIGLIPHTALAQTAKIKTERGIAVNRYLETSVKDIYALGDCAEVEGHVLPYITPLLNAARALAKTLTGERVAVDYPAMPVMVKTPVHPLAICPPPKGTSGNWQIETIDNAVRALFYDTDKQLRGFVLTNDAVKERMSLAKQIPALF